MNASLKRMLILLITVSSTGLLAPSTKARYYDPSTGRFLQEDPEQPGHVRVQGGRAVVINPSSPFMLRQQSNAYPYVKNNPVNFTDPYGLLERGTGQWSHVRGEAEKRLRGEAGKAKEAGLQCPVISGTREDESIGMVSEAIADEVTPKEYGFFGTGLLNEQNANNIDRRLRQKYPDWPWAGWDEIKKELTE